MTALPASATPEPEPINIALKEHQLGAEDWPNRKLMAEFHTWSERFSVVFKLESPTPALAIQRLKRRRLGHFRPGRNDWGAFRGTAAPTEKPEGKFLNDPPD